MDHGSICPVSLDILSIIINLLFPSLFSVLDRGICCCIHTMKPAVGYEPREADLASTLTRTWTPFVHQRLTPHIVHITLHPHPSSPSSSDTSGLASRIRALSCRRLVLILLSNMNRYSCSSSLSYIIGGVGGVARREQRSVPLQKAV